LVFSFVVNYLAILAKFPSAHLSLQTKTTSLPTVNLNDYDYRASQVDFFPVSLSSASAAANTNSKSPCRQRSKKGKPVKAPTIRELAELPPEILAHVMSFLRPTDLCYLAEASKYFFNVQSPSFLSLCFNSIRLALLNLIYRVRTGVETTSYRQLWQETRVQIASL